MVERKKKENILSCLVLFKSCSIKSRHHCHYVSFVSGKKNYSLESKNYRPAKEEKTKPMKTSLKRIVFENTLAKTKPKKSSQI